MIQSCAERLDGPPYKIILVRILNLAMVSAFYYQFFEVVKTEIKKRIKKLTIAGAQILSHAKSDKFKNEREQVVSDLLNINYTKYVCDGKEPIAPMKDILNDKALKELTESCENGKLTTPQKKSIFSYFNVFGYFK